MRKQFHYDWHWFWDYGNGDLGNQGIHEMDMPAGPWARTQLSKGVVSVGGRFGYIDDGQTPNTQIAVFDYGDCELIFEVRGLKTDPLKNVKIGNIIYGSDGYLVIYDYANAIAFTKDGEVIKKFGGGGDHFANFVKAVRSRQGRATSTPTSWTATCPAPCAISATISYRLGTRIAVRHEVRRARQRQGGRRRRSSGWNSTLRTTRCRWTETKYRVGRKLKVDPKTETFVGDKEADALLTRHYRKGFVVPSAPA